MKETVDKANKQLKDFFTEMSKKNKIRLGIAVGVIIILAIVVVVLINRTTYGVLYTNLDNATAGEIYSALEEKGVKKTLNNEGDFMTILVPEGDVDTLRIELESEGIVGEELDLTILDKATGFGTTDYEKRIFAKYQSQKDLREVINQYDKVENSYVSLNPVQETAFVLRASDEEATAAVQLLLAGDEPLTTYEAHTIRQYISDAEGISVENITITDNKLNPYPQYDEDAEEDLEITTQEQILLKQEHEKIYNDKVEELLRPVYGEGASVAANVYLNFDSVQKESRVFEPVMDDGGIAVAVNRLYEAARYGDLAGGIPGTDTNLPGTAEYPWEDLTGDEVYAKWQEEINYEVTEHLTQITRAKGTVDDISIGVMIDSTALSEEVDLDEVTEMTAELVANSVGITDLSLVSVSAMPFADISGDIQQKIDDEREFMNDLKKKEMIKNIIIWVIIALIIFMIFAFLRQYFKSKEDEEFAQLILADGSGVGIDYLIGEDGIALMDEELELSPKSEGVEKLETLIDKDAAAVASLLRNWLDEE